MAYQLVDDGGLNLRNFYYRTSFDSIKFAVNKFKIFICINKQMHLNIYRQVRIWSYYLRVIFIFEYSSYR